MTLTRPEPSLQTAQSLGSRVATAIEQVAVAGQWAWLDLQGLDNRCPHISPRKRGLTLKPGAPKISSDGGEANLFILAEQPGDDARASTVSTLSSPNFSSHRPCA